MNNHPLANVSVNVKDQDEANLQGVFVEIVGTEITCTTGSGGGCTLQEVPLGNISYTAVKDGYVTGNGTFTVTSNSGTLEITLTEEE
ncbi:carboxypeptidase regulatory-like domain-containing protein [Methanobrevibacter filiformis]|uniref:carboxypeptidase regulatory-like domain-containing protein n=1 Tax=Methanobrevibacter filiformis TaxID=55758 RepID=UPI000AE249CF|nr:carboxypeptidase regulatory-like domain-containing protein [Methanobrevibacter filiformis]